MTKQAKIEHIEHTENDIMAHTKDIVVAYLRTTPTNDVSKLIQDVYSSLMSKNQLEVVEPAKLTPRVPIENSITADYIVCLEDGVALKILKRHLKATYNMTPEEYIAKWNLPLDYPMIAPNYSKVRSALAKKSRFGKK